MSAPVTRRLFIHAETDKAVLVSPKASYHGAERDGGWLPRSQIEIRERRVAFNPQFGEAPQIALILGTVVDLTAPGWLLESRRLTENAPVPDDWFECPEKGRCPHGLGLNLQCDDCVAEHRRATA